MTVVRWKIIKLDETSSTNDEAKKYCRSKGQFFVVTAKRQTSGRGRGDRRWLSLEGNLFFSMALEFKAEYIGQLVIVSSLSMVEAIQKLSPEADVQLKWPNDILLKNAKVCGILLEKGEGDYFIVGIGVNIAKAPSTTSLLYPATSLAQEEIYTVPDEFLDIYLHCFTNNLMTLGKEGFARLKAQWMQKVKGLGREIIVRQINREDRGIFAGISDDGGLLLRQNTTVKHILAGDVFYIENE